MAKLLGWADGTGKLKYRVFPSLLQSLLATGLLEKKMLPFL